MSDWLINQHGYLDWLAEQHLTNETLKGNYMAGKTSTVYASGTIYWAKIVGEQALVSNYDGDGKEWTFEFEPDDPSFLKDHRLLDRLKDPLAYAKRLEERGEDEKAQAAREGAEGRGDYLLLKKPELDRDGNKNTPFNIYDDDNQPWGESRLIGNGSKADVKLSIVDWGAGKKKSIYCKAIRITDHVPYESNPFGGMDNANPVKQEKSAAKTTTKPKTKATADDFAELDDDIPFD